MSDYTVSQWAMQGLRNLTPAELMELDAMVTPRVAFLLYKAFGPEMAALLWPLIQNDGPNG